MLIFSPLGAPGWKKVSQSSQDPVLVVMDVERFQRDRESEGLRALRVFGMMTTFVLELRHECTNVNVVKSFPMLLFLKTMPN